jgi:hypothetical protein
MCSRAALLQAARRRQAASATSEELQKRARQFYRERLGSVLAEAKLSGAT